MLPHSALSGPALAANTAAASDTAPPSAGTALRLDVRRFPWIRRLVADYAFDYLRLADFFAGDPAEPSNWTDAIRRAQQYDRPRDGVADLLQAQQRRRGAPAEALAAAAQLRDPRTVAVVSGQQAGLFGGPLFTLLKALTAVRLAESVRHEHGVPAVAIFWIDAEDHDWDEVRSCGVLDGDANFRTVALGAESTPPGTVIDRVILDEAASAAIAELEGALQPTEFTAGVIESLRACYAPGVTMADAFGRLLETLLGRRGLIVYNAADPAAKPLAADLFVHEIEHTGETTRLAARAGAALADRGYHAQVATTDGGVALFRLTDRREPIVVDGFGSFRIGDRTIATAELVSEIRQAPHGFSPNVLLRPLVQDTLFPTVCYVPGPSELAYLGQLKDVYAAFGIPMPLFHQRATMTLLDSNAMRFLSRHDLPLETLRARDESALNELLGAQLPPEVEAALEGARRTIEERMRAVTAAVATLDATLEGAANSTIGRMQDDLKKLNGKVIQAAKRKDETLRRQFRHAQAQAFPGGGPQERQIGVVYFLNRYGPALIDRIYDVLPGEMGTHYVISA